MKIKTCWRLRRVAEAHFGCSVRTHTLECDMAHGCYTHYHLMRIEHARVDSRHQHGKAKSDYHLRDYQLLREEESPAI
jgi:hypothetical protein